MRTLIPSFRSSAWLGGLALLVGGSIAAPAQTPELLIHITSSGAGAFGPPQTVQVGQTVHWHNDMAAAHTVTRDGKDFQPADRIAANGDLTRTVTADMFGADGRMLYHCDFHPEMQGELRLTGGTSPTPPTPPAQGDTIRLTISGDGDKATIAQEGTKESKPAKVNVGQTVHWTNQTQQQHVFDLTAPDKTVIAHFVIAPTNGTFDKKFEAADFQKAGGKDNATVTLTYGSQSYPGVKSSILLTGTAPVTPPKPPTPPAPAQPAPPVVAGGGIPPAIGTPYGMVGVFQDAVVDDTITNSYYIVPVDMNHDGRPDLLTSGLGAPEFLADPSLTEDQKDQYRGTVAWYENPTWKRHVIAKLDVPVPVDAADIDGDGNPDVVVSWNYGLCIFNCNPDNGITSWFKNPGADMPDAPWKRYPLAHLMANHRVFFGHYTQLDRLELLALPVVGGAKGRIHDPIHSTVFIQPNDPINAQAWEAIDANSTYTLIHDASIHKYLSNEGVLLDSALIASGEGVSWLYYDKDKKFKSVLIGTGEQFQDNIHHFKGTGGVAACKLEGDPFSYIAAQEPLHGNILALYTKDSNGSVSTLHWKRQVLDTFGPLNDNGEGPMHQVIAADFDGDGNDEFLVALRGPLPHQGVYIYKAVDPAHGKFIRQRLSSISAARIAVADFDGDGLPDFATTPYDVSTYYDAKETHMMVFYNRTPQLGAARRAP